MSRVITRRRVTVKGTEKSVLDFFVVCSRVLEYVDRMSIDEDRNYSLVNYNMKKGQVRPTETDHNPMILDLNISFEKSIKQRVEVYNLKNQECQQIFREITSNSSNLSKCFMDGNSLSNQVKSWERNFTSAIKESFNRIRITDKKQDSESQQLMGKRRVLRSKLKTATDENMIEDIQKDIQSVESQISSLLVDDNLTNLSNTDGSTAVSGVWKLTNNLLG
jgi:hypothetical protein